MSTVTKIRKYGKSFLGDDGRAYGTGRRKSSVARVWMKKGTGKFSVNGKELKDYFVVAQDFIAIESVFGVLSSNITDFDINATVKGGGATGQSGAIVLGLSRALTVFDEDNRVILRNNGFLTRDSRCVESKKYGRKKARKRFQFSKR